MGVGRNIDLIKGSQSAGVNKRNQQVGHFSLLFEMVDLSAYD